MIYCNSPRKSEGVCFYQRWFVCLSVCVCASVCDRDN